MAIGWGYAVGEGAEAASEALHTTLNYKTALALQQVRVGIEKEKLAMDKDRQAMDMERIQQAIDVGKIEEQEARADLKGKLREERLIRKGEHFISQAKSLEKMAGRETPSGKPPWQAGAIPEISAGRKVEAFDMAGREAPLKIQNLAEEEAMTPFQKKLRDTEFAALEAGISSTQALAINRLREDMPDVLWDKQKTDARLEISKLYNNIVFTAMPEWKQKYPSAQSWFDQVIRGGTAQSSAAGKNVSSQIQELKGYGYTPEILNDETVIRELKADGYDIENIKANWDAE